MRDRLKELDPPPLTNYLDPATIESINKAKKDPAAIMKVNLKNKKSEQQERDAAKREHAGRIQKMKELYGMFLQMENEEKSKEETGRFN